MFSNSPNLIRIKVLYSDNPTIGQFSLETIILTPEHFGIRVYDLMTLGYHRLVKALLFKSGV